MAYQVSNFIISIKNSAAARRKDVILSYSKINKNIAEVLIKEGFLSSIKEDVVDKNKVLVATLKYSKRVPVIRDVKVISKPSLRVYTDLKNINEIKRKGRYKVILSTNKGIMESREARKLGVGGEILFTIY